MKRIPFILLLAIYVHGFAGVPQAFTYQAVARDSTGNVLQITHLGFRFSIHDSILTGAILYQETDTVTTDRYGGLSIAVGYGTVVQGSLSGINWNSGSKYLQVELDPNGGTNYNNMGTTLFTSVPNALFTETAQTSANAGNWNDYAIFDEIEPSGDSSSSIFTQAAWSSRYLNHTEALAGSSISITGNDTITLVPGTYHISASAPYQLTITAVGNGTNLGFADFGVSSVLRVRRISPLSDSTLLVGQSNSQQGELAYPASGTFVWREEYLATMEGVITVAVATNISLDQFINIFNGGTFCNGGGQMGTGENEVYARITIQRIQ